MRLYVAPHLQPQNERLFVLVTGPRILVLGACGQNSLQHRARLRERFFACLGVVPAVEEQDLVPVAAPCRRDDEVIPTTGEFSVAALEEECLENSLSYGWAAIDISTAGEAKLPHAVEAVISGHRYRPFSTG